MGNILDISFFSFFLYYFLPLAFLSQSFFFLFFSFLYFTLSFPLLLFSPTLFQMIINPAYIKTAPPFFFYIYQERFYWAFSSPTVPRHPRGYPNWNSFLFSFFFPTKKGGEKGEVRRGYRSMRNINRSNWMVLGFSQVWYLDHWKIGGSA